MCYDLCVKVQVRHWPCGQVVSCVCAVAIREGDLILAADMCADGVMRYISNNQALPIGTWIDVFAGGYGFQVSLCTNQNKFNTISIIPELIHLTCVDFASAT